MTKEQIIEKLNLRSLEFEGGRFFETYRSALTLDKSMLPPRFAAHSYTVSTSIYYLLCAGEKSRMHSVAADETWYFHASSDSGVYILLAAVSPEGEGKTVKIGSRILDGHVPQFTVPAGWAMGAVVSCDEGGGRRLETNGAWVLAGANVAPSFECADFRREDARAVAARCPALANIILEIG